MTVKVDLRDGIVFIEVPEVADERVAQEIIDEELRLIREMNNGKPTPLVVDSTRIKSVSAEARKMFGATARLDELRKVAVVGGSIFTNITTKSSLQSGLKWAMQQTQGAGLERQVVPEENAPRSDV